MRKIDSQKIPKVQYFWPHFVVSQIPFPLGRPNIAPAFFLTTNTSFVLWLINSLSVSADIENEMVAAYRTDI
jgi:hypothetical protein